MKASVEARASVSVRASDEKNQRSSVRSRSHSHSDFVPGRGLEPLRLRTRPSNVLVYQFQHPGRPSKIKEFEEDDVKLRILWQSLHFHRK